MWQWGDIHTLGEQTSIHLESKPYISPTMIPPLAEALMLFVLTNSGRIDHKEKQGELRSFGQKLLKWIERRER